MWIQKIYSFSGHGRTIFVQNDPYCNEFDATSVAKAITPHEGVKRGEGRDTYTHRKTDREWVRERERERDRDRDRDRDRERGREKTMVPHEGNYQMQSTNPCCQDKIFLLQFKDLLFVVQPLGLHLSWWLPLLGSSVRWKNQTSSHHGIGSSPTTHLYVPCILWRSEIFTPEFVFFTTFNFFFSQKLTFWMHAVLASPHFPQTLSFFHFQDWTSCLQKLLCFIHLTKKYQLLLSHQKHP